MNVIRSNSDIPIMIEIRKKKKKRLHCDLLPELLVHLTAYRHNKYGRKNERALLLSLFIRPEAKTAVFLNRIRDSK